MKVLRSTLIAGAAFFAAACGDKVNVVQPTPAVHSISVSPATATMSIGDKITLQAAVVADAGVATTVTWASGDATKATVDATGLVTAVAATPGVAICATSTANTSVKGCGSVTVAQQAVPVPATVSIQSITAGPLGLNGPVPVPPAVVAGQINVTVNATPGTSKVDSIVVTVNGKSAAVQSFSAAQAAALRSAADQAIAQQAVTPTVVLSINTAAFNPTTGVPSWQNGPAAIGATIYSHLNGAAATANANNGVSLLFGNVDAAVITATTTGNTANSAAGFTYKSGGITGTLLPVFYTPGRAIGVSATGVVTGTITFGSLACDANGTGARTQPLVAPAAAGGAYTFAFTTTPTGAAIATGVKNYEFATAACPVQLAAGGESFTVTGTDNAGNGLALVVAGAPTFRLDNRAPGLPTIVQNPNNRQNGWVNASVQLVGINTTTPAVPPVVPSLTSNGMVVQGAVDAGVGGYLPQVRIGAPGAGNIVDPVLALTPSQAPTLPAPSATNNSYCAVYSAVDLLGNETARPAAGTACSPSSGVGSAVALNSQSTLFGVDIAPPTIALPSPAAGLAASTAGTNASTGANVGGEFIVAVTDTGIVGNSGMLAGAPVIGTVTIRNPQPAGTFTAAALCPVGTLSTAGVCTASSVGFAVSTPLTLPNVTTNVITPLVIVGYYTYTANSVDAAGNVSTNAISIVHTYDPAATTPALTTALFNTPLTGSTVVFNANSSDDFDLWKATYNMTYAGAGLAGPILYPSTILNTFNTAPFVNSNVAAGVTVNGFMRQVEVVSGANPLATGGQFKPTQLSGTVLDMAGLSSGAVNTVIPGTSVTTGVTYTGPVGPQQAVSWAITNVAKNISTGAGPAAAANPLSIALTAAVAGPTATFNPPFTTVVFFAFVGANLEQIGSTSSYSTVDNGSTNGRVHTFTFTWTPGTKSPVSGTGWTLGAQQIYAVGVNANGDALVSPANALITLTNP